MPGSPSSPLTTRYFGEPARAARAPSHLTAAGKYAPPRPRSRAAFTVLDHGFRAALGEDAGQRRVRAARIASRGVARVGDAAAVRSTRRCGRDEAGHLRRSPTRPAATGVEQARRRRSAVTRAAMASGPSGPDHRHDRRRPAQAPAPGRHRRAREAAPSRLLRERGQRGRGADGEAAAPHLHGQASTGGGPAPRGAPDAVSHRAGPRRSETRAAPRLGGIGDGVGVGNAMKPGPGPRLVLSAPRRGARSPPRQASASRGADAADVAAVDLDHRAPSSS